MLVLDDPVERLSSIDAFDHLTTERNGKRRLFPAWQSAVVRRVDGLNVCQALVALGEDELRLRQRRVDVELVGWTAVVGGDKAMPEFVKPNPWLNGAPLSKLRGLDGLSSLTRKGTSSPGPSY